MPLPSLTMRWEEDIYHLGRGLLQQTHHSTSLKTPHHIHMHAHLHECAQELISLEAHIALVQLYTYIYLPHTHWRRVRKMRTTFWHSIAGDRHIAFTMSYVCLIMWMHDGMHICIISHFAPWSQHILSDPFIEKMNYCLSTHTSDGEGMDYKKTYSNFI